MIVIADTSVISNLAIIGRADLLPKIHGDIVVPSSVWEELQNGAKNHPSLHNIFGEGWLRTCAVTDRLAVAELLRELDEGEAEAIVLARELHADLLLGRKAWSARGGTLGSEPDGASWGPSPGENPGVDCVSAPSHRRFAAQGTFLDASGCAQRLSAKSR